MSYHTSHGLSHVPPHITWPVTCPTTHHMACHMSCHTSHGLSHVLPHIAWPVTCPATHRMACHMSCHTSHVLSHVLPHITWLASRIPGTQVAAIQGQAKAKGDQCGSKVGRVGCRPHTSRGGIECRMWCHHPRCHHSRTSTFIHHLPPPHPSTPLHTPSALPSKILSWVQSVSSAAVYPTHNTAACAGPACVLGDTTTCSSRHLPPSPPAHHQLSVNYYPFVPSYIFFVVKSRYTADASLSKVSSSSTSQILIVRILFEIICP